MVDAYMEWVCGECGKGFETQEEAEACCDVEPGEEPEEEEDED